ncbi:MAG: hypothetical protein A3J24_06435 [Deltaproteobacteria bacterium RIFCSPLOWO2_02_FULL_53_8]|nr:MAG: hypothetical protein A3J24_06435 [Deltaproteobacteria bacterium RIFCSPLOWO2_02_FULL_53_8]
MSESAIRASIKTMLSAVTGAGIVFDYERSSVDAEKFLSLFKDATSGNIFGWEITRTGCRIEKPTQKFKATHSYVLKGYYSVRDATASEKLFNLIIEAVVAKFLSVKIADTQGICLPQIALIDTRVIGGVSIHHAEVRLDVAEIVEQVSDETLTDLLKVELSYYLKPGDEVVDAADTVEMPL